MTHVDHLKRELKVYKFVRRNIGKEFSSRYLKGVCGVRQKTDFNKTRMRKYTIPGSTVPFNYNSISMNLIEDLIWIDKSFISEIVWSITAAPHLGLHLVSKEKIPFWKLEEYGGVISEDELERRTNHHLINNT